MALCLREKALLYKLDRLTNDKIRNLLFGYNKELDAWGKRKPLPFGGKYAKPIVFDYFRGRLLVSRIAYTKYRFRPRKRERFFLAWQPKRKEWS